MIVAMTVALTDTCREIIAASLIASFSNTFAYQTRLKSVQLVTERLALNEKIARRTIGA
jgi:hypothetical protein